MYLRNGSVDTSWYAAAPFASVPPDKRWSLGLLYLVFAAVVIALYFPCRWYADAKATRRGRWMSYI
jgi:hypothetical protein